MKSSSRLPLLVLIVLSGAFAGTAEAQWGPRPYRPLDQQWRTQERQLYRPGVHVVRSKGASRKFGAGTPQTIEYSVMRGFVSRLEVRSGMRMIQAIPLPGPSRSGRVVFTPPPGLGDFKLWAWQGQPGHQSVHGESVKYTSSP